MIVCYHKELKVITLLRKILNTMAIQNLFLEKIFSEFLLGDKCFPLENFHDHGKRDCKVVPGHGTVVANRYIF